MAKRKGPMPSYRRGPNAVRGQKPKFNLTDEILKEIEILAGRGLTNEMIHNYYGVGKDTWYNAKIRCPEIEKAFQRGKARTISMVSGKLMEKIRHGSLEAIKFYLRTQAQWIDRAVQVSDNKGAALPAPPLVITASDPVEASKVYQEIMARS
jgi:nitrogen regulatory protein PII-like uncharacterized protein